jgi:hypothetical protein
MYNAREALAFFFFAIFFARKYSQKSPSPFVAGFLHAMK